MSQFQLPPLPIFPIRVKLEIKAEPLTIKSETDPIPLINGSNRVTGGVPLFPIIPPFLPPPSQYLPVSVVDDTNSSDSPPSPPTLNQPLIAIAADHITQTHSTVLPISKALRMPIPMPMAMAMPMPFHLRMPMPMPMTMAIPMTMALPTPLPMPPLAAAAISTTAVSTAVISTATQTTVIGRNAIPVVGNIGNGAIKLTTPTNATLTTPILSTPHIWTELHLRKLRKYVRKYSRNNHWFKIAKRMRKYQNWSNAYLCEQKWTELQSNGKKRWQCDECQKTFASKNGLKYHRYVHTNDWPFRCELCNKGFVTDVNLSRHMRTHTKEKPFHCKQCQSAFSRKSHLEGHMLTHSNIKAYQCSYCGQRFRHKCTLNNHIRTHTNEKPYKCEICGVAFAHNISYVTHKRRHNGEKPFKCSYDGCDKRCAAKSDLNDHIKRIHTGERPHSCKQCDKKFLRNYELLLHIRKYHS